MNNEKGDEVASRPNALRIFFRFLVYSITLFLCLYIGIIGRFPVAALIMIALLVLVSLGLRRFERSKSDLESLPQNDL